MAIKHALMVSMMGRVADRFHEYQSTRGLIGRLELAKQVTNADGIEIVYPSEFKNMQETIRIVKESGLTVSAVNLNVKQEKRWQRGSFTNPDPDIRRQAVQEMRVAMDLAVEFGTDGTELFLKEAELFVHAEDDVDAGEVDAELVDQALGLADALNVAVGIHADVAGGALRFDEAGALVVAQGLLVHADEVGGDGDDVAGLVFGHAITGERVA